MVCQRYRKMTLHFYSHVERKTELPMKRVKGRVCQGDRFGRELDAFRQDHTRFCAKGLADS
jgi:hypothetical protein